MLKELRQLIKHTSVYGAGTVLSKLVGFLMIPFYTHYLGPADYGILELLDLSLSLVALVLTTWMQASLVRFYKDSEDEQSRNQVVSTMLVFSLCLGIVTSACGIYFSRSLSSLLLKTPELHSYVAVVSVSFLVSCVNLVCIGYLRARQRSSQVVLSGTVTMILTLSLNIYLIAVRHSGAIGILYSSLISNALVTTTLVIWTLSRVRVSFSTSRLLQMGSFGVPLIATAAAGFAVNFSDRFFLRASSTLSVVGIYALGYKFGYMISMLLVQPFDMIWQARIYDIAKQDNSGPIFSRLFEYYCFALVAAALALSMAIKNVIAISSSAAFHSAYVIVPVIASAYVFQGMNRFVLTGIYIAKKTMYLGAVGVISAAITLMMNAILIPRFGMMGAAWATVVSFVVMTALGLFVSQRIYPIPYVLSRIGKLLALAIVTYIISLKIPASSMIGEIGAKLVLLLVFPCALYLSGFFHDEERNRGRILVRQLMNRYWSFSAAEPE